MSRDPESSRQSFLKRESIIVATAQSAGGISRPRGAGRPPTLSKPTPRSKPSLSQKGILFFFLNFQESFHLRSLCLHLLNLFFLPRPLRHSGQSRTGRHPKSESRAPSPQSNHEKNDRRAQAAGPCIPAGQVADKAEAATDQGRPETRDDWARRPGCGPGTDRGCSRKNR